MHVYHTPLPSILCKLIPYRWDIPFLMFCTFFSLLLLFALMPLYQPVCGNTYNNNVHQFRDPPARRYNYLSSHVFCICTPQLLFFLRRWMRNSVGDSLQAKKTFAAITWDERILSHKVWSFCRFTIPLETNSVVH